MLYRAYDFDNLSDELYKKILTHFQKELIKKIKVMNKLSVGDFIDIEYYDQCVYTLIAIMQLYNLEFPRTKLQIMRFNTE